MAPILMNNSSKNQKKSLHYESNVRLSQKVVDDQCWALRREVIYFLQRSVTWAFREVYS